MECKFNRKKLNKEREADGVRMVITIVLAAVIDFTRSSRPSAGEFSNATNSDTSFPCHNIYIDNKKIGNSLSFWICK